MKTLLLSALVAGAVLTAGAATAQPYGYRDGGYGYSYDRYDRYDRGYDHHRRYGRGARDSDRDGVPDRVEWNRDRDRDGRPDQWDRYDNRRSRHYGGYDRYDRYDRSYGYRY